MKSPARPGSSFSMIAVVAIGAGCLILGGCGGRSLLTPKADGGGAGQTSGAAGGQGSAGTGSSGTAGSTGTAGSAAGTAGATGTAGSQSGTAGTTGSTSGAAGSTTGAAGGTSSGNAGTVGQGGQGGSAMCGPCPPADCKMGFMKVVDPTVSCCPVCRPINCAAVDCAAPPCPSGHLEVPDGQCCPVCVDGPPLACQKGRKDYVVFRSQVLEKYGSATCMVDQDCALYFENNQCQVNCGVAIATSLLDNLRSNLDGFAAMDCNTCPKPPLPPCAQFVALCSNGLCVRGSPPLK